MPVGLMQSEKSGELGLFFYGAGVKEGASLLKIGLKMH